MKRKPSHRPFSNKSFEELCGRPGPEDGVDPRVFFKPVRRRRDNRKDGQLCRQIFETLNYVLSGDCHDEILRNLIVVEVVPAPDTRRLLVTVCPFAPDATFNPTEAMQRLQQFVGRLRAEVAKSISRRKVPELAFRVVIDDSFRPSGTEVQDEQ